MNDDKKNRMMASCIKEAVCFAMENDMDYFYIGFPDTKNVQLEGIYVAKSNCKKFSEEVKGFFGKGYYINSDCWNKVDIISYLSKELGIPLWMILTK